MRCHTKGHGARRAGAGLACWGRDQTAGPECRRGKTRGGGRGGRGALACGAGAHAGALLQLSRGALFQQNPRQRDGDAAHARQPPSHRRGWCGACCRPRRLWCCRRCCSCSCCRGGGLRGVQERPPLRGAGVVALPACVHWQPGGRASTPLLAVAPRALAEGACLGKGRSKGSRILSPWLLRSW